MTLVSVVVPTTGRPSVVGVLDALRRQGADTPPFEVIVVVDGGPAAALPGAHRHPACDRVDVVRLERRSGVSVARNAGIEAARGHFVGFLDDDVIPAGSWVTTVARCLTTWTAVTGRILEDGDSSTLNALRRLAFDHRFQVVTAQATPAVDFLNGGNCAVRADTLRQIGGFDPRFPKSQDRHLARRLLRAGHTIGFAPDLIVEHHGNYTWRGLWRGRYAAGRANATLLADGDTTSVGPSTARDTYGDTLWGILLRERGPGLVAGAATAVAAERLGRRRPFDHC